MRDFVIIGGAALIAVVIGTAVFYFGPSSYRGDFRSAFASAGTTTIPFTVLQQGTNAVGVGARVNYIIDSKDELASLWPNVFGIKNAPAVPEVDFSKYEVLAIFDGMHQVGGYNVQVASVDEGNGTRDVIIMHNIPGSSCSNPSSQTSPYVLIEIPKTSDPLTHEDKKGVVSCN